MFALHDDMASRAWIMPRALGVLLELRPIGVQTTVFQQGPRARAQVEQKDVSAYLRWERQPGPTGCNHQNGSGSAVGWIGRGGFQRSHRKTTHFLVLMLDYTILCG